MTSLSKSLIEKKDLLYIHKKTQADLKLLSGKTLFYTGVNGFLGYYFIKSILLWNEINTNNQITLYLLDNFISGIPDWLRKQRHIRIFKKDIVKYRVPSLLNIDYIVHAASIASPIYYRQYPIETINANVLGLYNILTYMVNKQRTKTPVSGLLFFSTSEIYGDPTAGNIPTPETYRGNVSCTGPRSCYDESKRFGETLCVNYSRVYNLPIKIVRPFNNYGPGLKITDRRVIPDFANDILQNKDITLLSEGSPTRTFCYVADAIIGYLKVLTHGQTPEAYNIGAEEPEISMQELAEKMRDIAARHFGYTGRLIKKLDKDKNYLTDNPQRRCPDLGKARNDLGFNPEITLKEGLTNTLYWYKEEYGL